MIKIKLKSYSDPLEEGRVDDMKKKYPGKDDLVDQFATAPGNNKYLDWMLRHHEETSPDEMLKAVEKFDKYISQVKQKDINSYKNFEALQDTVEDLRPPKKELERKGSLSLYDDEEFSITRPTNKEAACKLGTGTKWCIAATKSINYFGRYAKGGSYHYFLKIKNLPSDDPKHHVAYTLIQSKTDKPSVEIYDAEDTLIDRRAVTYAIETASDESSAEQKEEKLFQIMLADFQNQAASDPGDPTDEHYDTLVDTTASENVSWDLPDRVASIIYNIFYDNDADQINSSPRFVKRQIRRLVAMNNEYVDKYFIKAFEDPRPNRIPRAINANITPEQKSEVLKRAEERKKKQDDYHKQRVNELADYIFNDPRYISTIDILRKGGYDEFIDRTFQGFFQSYTEREVEDAIQIVFEKMNKERSTNESKLFKFNKDKKMFKLLR